MRRPRHPLPRLLRLVSSVSGLGESPPARHNGASAFIVVASHRPEIEGIRGQGHPLPIRVPMSIDRFLPGRRGAERVAAASVGRLCSSASTWPSAPRPPSPSALDWSEVFLDLNEVAKADDLFMQLQLIMASSGVTLTHDANEHGDALCFLQYFVRNLW